MKKSISERFDFAALKAKYIEGALPLFIISESGSLTICPADSSPSPQPGQTVIAIVDPPGQSEPAPGIEG